MVKNKYYAFPISKNRSRTPDGFLICFGTPIARTGIQKYLGKEVGLNEAPDQFVAVYRDESEVFNPITLTSFEGKPITNDHPPVFLSPENAKIYTRGVTTNVRRGEGTDKDLILADLIVYDENLSRDIESGRKTEVSAGYACDYIPVGDLQFRQVDIVANHVAIVENGRAGDRVRVRDRKPTIERSNKDMSEQAKSYKLPRKSRSGAKDFLAAIGIKYFAVDGEPEEIMEAVDELAKEKILEIGKDAEIEELQIENGQHEEKLSEVDELKKKIAELESKLAAAEAAKDAPPPEETGLEGLEELEKEFCEAEGGKEPPATKKENPFDQSAAEEGEEGAWDNEGFDEADLTSAAKGPVTPKEDRPKNPIPTADHKALLAVMKPIIANIPDVKTRKQAVDSLSKVLRLQRSESSNNYAKMLDRKKTQDQAPEDYTDIGRKIRDQYNPHYAKKAGK